MRELLYIADTLFGLIVGAFLLRLLCQLVRTDFRNPLVQAVVRITNPLVMPLRRVLPPLGRLDTASLVAVLLAQLALTALVRLLMQGALPPVEYLLLRAVVDGLDTTLLIYLVAVFAYVVLSWVSPDGYNPAGRLLHDLVDPLLRPLRRALPPLAGLDLSPLALILLLSVLRMVLNGRIAPLLGV
jgi:YggT family protein